MALIKCPECLKNVSSEAQSCPHCGYPIIDYVNSDKIMYTIINGQKKDVTYFVKKILDGSWWDDSNFNSMIMRELDVPMMGFADAVKECGGAPKEYNAESIKEFRAKQQFARAREAQKVHCPYCKSTNVKKISLTGKALSVGTLGILSKKIGKQWHCNNCKSDF